ncbi:serine/threonine-protein kinase [Actinomadura sp. NPDC048955]|uniref:serine/threonine-protein kinase n=1 Tax=Actinomadura sp. NPDC048955 TaxID=3158228 RepID=UPI0033F33196
MLVAGRYLLEEPIGKGGMGEVWRATDQSLERTVAVKLLLTTAPDPQARERFLMEAQTAARLSDPHVVAVYDFGTHEGRLFLVMEYVDGHSLAREGAVRGAMTPARVADIAAQAAAGLSAAHRQGVVHRDIKPGNLLLAADGTLKIADFGIARFTGEASAALTMTGQVIGTSTYLAPERGLGRPAGAPSDVYSLGCVLYELLTGRPPFHGDSAAAVVFQHVDAAPVPPRHACPGLPGAFEDYLMRLLSKQPEQRPTAPEVAAWFAERPWHADRPTPETAVTSTARLPVVDLPSPAPRTRSWTRYGIVAGAAAAAVVIAGGIGLAVASDGDRPTPSPTVSTSAPSAGSASPRPSPENKSAVERHGPPPKKPQKPAKRAPKRKKGKHK